MKRIRLIHLDTSSIEAVIAVLLMASVCSCGQTEVSLVPQQTAIGFVPSDAASSRAVVTNVAALQEFYVYGLKNSNTLFNKQQVAKGSDAWTYSPIKYWDTASDVTYTFGAVAGVKDATKDLSTLSASTITVSNIPQWQEVNDDAQDFLVSNVYSNQPLSVFSGGTVHFNFTHQLAYLQVKAQKVSTSGGTTDTDTYAIKEIKLQNGLPTNTERTFTLQLTDGAMTWSEAGATGADKTLFPASSSSSGGSSGSNSSIELETTPNDITSWLIAPFTCTDTEMQVTYTQNDTPKTSTISLNDKLQLSSFEGNHKYVITLKVGATLVNAEVLEIQGWTQENEVDDPVYNW